MQRGDQLKTLNDVVFTENREKIRELIVISDGEDKTLVLKLERDGKEMIVEVNPARVPPFPKSSDGTPPPTGTPITPPDDYY